MPERGETSVAQACGLLAGCVAVVGAACAAALCFGPHDMVPRALLVGVAVGWSSALVRDWRHRAGTALFGALVFVGFLAHRDGDLTGGASAWSYTALIVLLAVLGHAARLRAGSGIPSRVR
jgi:hypothetical protein